MKYTGVGVLTIFVVGIIVGLYFYLQRPINPAESNQASVATAFNAVPNAGFLTGRVPPKGSRIYEDALYTFSLFYPEVYTVRAHFLPGEVTMIAFEKEKEKEGFQIYVTPFLEAQITDERFKKDLPSGIRKKLQEMTVDGAAGAAFDSEDRDLGGETREVWFVKNGYLFEVTAPKQFEVTLLKIMESWEFFKN